MPLVHTKCTKFRYPIPGKFDPETGTHGRPIWATGCRSKSSSATARPRVTILDAGLDRDQLRAVSNIARTIESDASNRGFDFTISITDGDKTMGKYHQHDRFDFDAFRQDCRADMEAIARRVLERNLGDARPTLGDACGGPPCGDLLISAETFALLKSGPRNSWVDTSLVGLAAGATTPPVTIPPGAIGVSTTYCLSDFVINAGAAAGVDADSFRVNVYVNGRERVSFLGGRVRTTATCNTLCGWCVCVGALETLTVTYTNLSGQEVPPGVSATIEWVRWFPGEEGYSCTPCSACHKPKAQCGCKRPPLSHGLAEVG